MIRMPTFILGHRRNATMASTKIAKGATWCATQPSIKTMTTGFHQRTVMKVTLQFIRLRQRFATTSTTTVMA